MLSLRPLVFSRQSRPVWELATSLMHMIHSSLRTISDKCRLSLELRFFKHWNSSPSPSNSRNSVIQSLSLCLMLFLSLTKFWRVGFRSQAKKWTASDDPSGASSSSSELASSSPTTKPSDLYRFILCCFFFLLNRPPLDSGMPSLMEVIITNQKVKRFMSRKPLVLPSPFKDPRNELIKLLYTHTLQNTAFVKLPAYVLSPILNVCALEWYSVLLAICACLSEMHQWLKRRKTNILLK